MYRDHAPVNATCPKIDKVINKLNRIYNSNEEINASELGELEKAMEEIRRDNAQLRAWGNEQWREVERLEVEVSNLENERENLKDELEDLKKLVQNQ